MKKIISIFYFIFLVHFMAIGQFSLHPNREIRNVINPQHGFFIYITDAIGNVDSVFIGLDPTATNEIDPEFGEENIKNIPFKEGLDVRIANPVKLDYYENDSYFDNDPTLWHSKIQVLNFDCADDLLSRYATIIAKSNNYPLTFSWDKNYFNESCFSHSVLSFMNFTFWFDIGASYTNGLPAFIYQTYLKDEQTFVTDDIPYFNNTINFLPEYYVDSNHDTVRLLYLGLFSEKWKLADINEEPENEWVKIYPNPVSEEIVIHFFEDKSWENIELKLYNMTGQLVHHTQINQFDHRISIRNSELTNGTYILRLLCADKKFNKAFKLNIAK